MAHPAWMSPRRNTARNSCRLYTNRSMEKMFGMAVVNVSSCLNEKSSSFEVRWCRNQSQSVNALCGIT